MKIVLITTQKKDLCIKWFEIDVSVTVKILS